MYRVMALVVTVVGVAAAQRGPFTVGPIAARPGEAVSAMIDVPPASDPGTQIPVTVVHGAGPGPVLALIAGNHGYEYTPVLALQRLRERLDPRRLRGTAILVHIANLPSFLGRTIYYSPADRKNLNRVYPGKRDGTTSERIAYTITKEVIERSDYLLDLHAGDGNESLRPYCYQPVTGNARMDREVEQMALALGFDHIVLDRGRPADPAASVYCSTTAVTRGKPALTVESGFLGVLDEASIDRIVEGVENLMRHLRMLNAEPARVRNPLYIEPAEVLTSPATGILYPQVERDQRVGKGALLARLTDFFGKPLGEVRAPFDGIVLYVVATPPITKGEPVAFVGAVRK